MKPRSDEEFLRVEGLSKERAKRIYRAAKRVYSYGCGETVYPTDIVMNLFTGDTTHGGYTSAQQFLCDIGEPNKCFEADLCDTVHCDLIECCMRSECNAYGKEKEEFDDV